MTILQLLFSRRQPLAATALLLALAWPGVGLATKLRSRLPDPWNGNRHVVVVTDEPAPPIGTPLVRLAPSLEVLGVVEGRAGGVGPVASDVRLRVSIYREATAEGLPREDSRIELRVTTPDLLEVVTKHFTPERRARIAAKVEAWRAAHEQAIDRALARVRLITDRELGADELGRKLAADPLLSDALSRAFERELVDPIDWARVVRRALGSDAASSTGELLLHAGPIGSSWAGLRSVFRERWARARGETAKSGEALTERGNRTLDALREGDPDAALLEGGGLIGGFLGSLGGGDLFRLARDPTGWVVDHALPDARDWDAWKTGAGAKAGENIAKALPSRKDRLRRDYAALGRELGRETALDDRALGFVRALSGDAALRDELVKRHGPEARARLERLAAALADDAELAAHARSVVDSGLELLAGVLRELCLDEAGKGPNPLLVALVRARLLGRAEPVLVLVEPGTQLAVSEDQVFVSRRR